ncbi:hypothetical protein BJ878DRAFT_550480 [Calycina marina]|uniref:Uncharacterized protein n=1 Tax=Calycina marina TaxID=1763456 RepID=A0A9P7Z2X7_9HELO|nr:hypothetical protein BJ878DRAFT_550480 [Calycina marina]
MSKPGSTISVIDASTFATAIQSSTSASQTSQFLNLMHKLAVHRQSNMNYQEWQTINLRTTAGRLYIKSPGRLEYPTLKGAFDKQRPVSKEDVLQKSEFKSKYLGPVATSRVQAAAPEQTDIQTLQSLGPPSNTDNAQASASTDSTISWQPWASQTNPTAHVFTPAALMMVLKSTSLKPFWGFRTVSMMSSLFLPFRSNAGLMVSGPPSRSNTWLMWERCVGYDSAGSRHRKHPTIRNQLSTLALDGDTHNGTVRTGKLDMSK